MPILNMVYSTSGWWWPNIPLDAIDDLSVAPWNAEATIAWTDPWDLVVRWYTITSWVSTKLVRKVGSAPSSSSDWTLVLTETVRDQYSSTGYTDTWLTNWTTYYYAAFAVWDNGTESISNVRNVTPSSWWTPWADTIWYYPLTSSTQWTDQSGNGRDFTAHGSITYWTYGWVSCCYVNQWQLNYMFPNSGDWLPSSWNYTISLWYYHVANPSQDNGQMAQFSQGSNMWDSRIGMDIPVTWPSDVSNKPWLAIITSSWGRFSSPAISLTLNAWHHCVVTKNGSTLTLYVNWVSSASTTYGGYWDLWNYWISRDETYTRSIIGYVSNAIFEKKCWTASEVADYFDDTKADYWIS